MFIRIEGLRHTYLAGTSGEKSALRDINIEIEEGESLGVAGCSGSGKTTLIQHLNGILRPSAGRISVFGKEVTKKNIKELRKRIGVLFQEPEQQLFEETVLSEVAFGLRGSPLNPLQKEGRIREALREVGIGDELLEVSPFALSTGERRRVAIASVLVAGPEVLVLDEPTAGLDPRGRGELLELVADLRRRRGLTIILVSHNLDDIARVCDRVVVLKEGTVAMDGGTREVLTDLAGLETAGLRAPRIVRIMAELKREIPGLDERVLSVEEARAEIRRIMKKNGQRVIGNERNDLGELSPRRFRDPQGGSENEDNPGDALFDRCVHC